MISPVISLVGRRILPVILVMFLQPDLAVVKNTATVHFPSSIDFHLEATSSAPVTSAEIEVRTDAKTCGDGTTRAAPDEFTEGTSVSADWTWELRQTGALPPGTTITWKWHATTDGGQTLTTPEEHVTLEDDTYPWQTIETDTMRLSWYEGDKDFAQSLQTAAEDGMQRLDDTLGVTDDQPVRVYIYASSDDMQSATLYAPSWSGGLAFASENTLLLAVAPEYLTWGERAIAHELTHVIVNRHAFSCVNSTPTWFEEGLAMYFEGPPDPDYTSILEDAVQSDSLLSVRELSAILSGDPNLATLSYAESSSLVAFLIDVYGEDKLLQLIDEFKQGAPQDKALEAVYGFDRDGLEAEWRKHIGAQPMKEVAVAPDTAITPYPTLAPLTGPPLAETEIIPTPAYLSASSGPAVTPTPYNGLPAPDASVPDIGVSAGAMIVVAIGCGGLLLVAAVVIGGIVWLVRRDRGQDTLD